MFIRRLKKEKERSIYNINWEELTFFYKSKNIKIVLEEYPFKCPILLIDDKDHIDWFLSQYNVYKDMLNRYKLNNQCICCDTIVCKWVPTFNIDNLLDEFICYYDKFELFHKMNILFKKKLFDDLIYNTIFLYLII